MENKFRASGLQTLASLIASLLVGLTAPAAAQNSDFEAQRAKMRAEFDRMRSEHMSHMSPSGQAFVRDMDKRRNGRLNAEAASKQMQVRAAAAMTAKPSECALSFNNALLTATSFEQLRPYFTSHYYQAYVERKGAAGLQQELAMMKRNYVRECKVRGKDRIDTDGHADVWLEGYDSNGKGNWLNLRMVPESNYWRIDGYRSQTGLEVIKIPVHTFPAQGSNNR